MISAMLTAPPFGTPCAQADGCALPRAMFTIVISSAMVTTESPSQSPAQSGGAAVDVTPVGTVGVGVGVGVAEGVGLGVSARLGVDVTDEGGVDVAVVADVDVAVETDVAVAVECGVRVAVLVPVGAPVAV